MSAPMDSMEAVVREYRKGIDRTLLQRNLRLSVEERFRQLMELQKFARELRRAGRAADGK
ncbi:MAG: hypothetical protein HS104_41705 [Polyangiaceae bacterium]|nr:hypothetical protein [Polyangiaceae bacterium]MCL4751586.1 hypothetical protein [Myxococcales bacterium]